MTIREAFENGTDTFNAHDIDGFASVLADDVVYQAPGGISGRGKTPVLSSTLAGLGPSPTRTSRSTASTWPTMSSSRKALSPEPTATRSCRP
jgi:hypothetical protein